MYADIPGRKGTITSSVFGKLERSPRNERPLSALMDMNRNSNGQGSLSSNPLMVPLIHVALSDRADLIETYM